MVRHNLFAVWRQREAALGRLIPYDEVASGAGLSTATLGGLVKNKSARVDLRTLSRLCTFFDCTPGDLLVYEPGGEGRG